MIKEKYKLKGRITFTDPLFPLMKTLFSALLLLTVSTCFSQKAMTFQQASKSGVRISQLDSIYASALHSDSSKAVFWHSQEEFIDAYKSTLQTLGDFLKQNGFTWGKETGCFNRIYFNKEGGVDYFLYSFNKDVITPEKEKQFDVLLNRFIKDYKFPMKAGTGFSQCSPVRYRDHN
jgi:hypothetical protein